jgi:hypothetical protein
MAKGIIFQVQGSSPLPPSSPGVWVNAAGQLMQQNGSGVTQNMTQSITDFSSGSGITAVTRSYSNTTGSTIAAGIPVYSPAAGQIAPASGAVGANSRVIGITTVSIPNSTSGLIALCGTLELASSPGTHGAYLYLDTAAGTMTTTAPTLGPYPSGYNVVIIGIIEGNNIILKLQAIGTL